MKKYILLIFTIFLFVSSVLVNRQHNLSRDLSDINFSSAILIRATEENKAFLSDKFQIDVTNCGSWIHLTFYQFICI
jgi:hypothetical protein